MAAILMAAILMAAIIQPRRMISHSEAIAHGHGAGTHGWTMHPTLIVKDGGTNLILEDGEVIPSAQRVRSGRGDPTRALRACCAHEG